MKEYCGIILIHGVNDLLLLAIAPLRGIVFSSLLYPVRVSPTTPTCGLSSLHRSRDLDARRFVACPSFSFPGGSI
jgi:hypothetical protein